MGGVILLQQGRKANLFLKTSENRNLHFDDN